MSELAARSKKLVDEVLAMTVANGLGSDDDRTSAAKLIEQALLAERRLARKDAFEEAIVIADNEGLSEEVGAGDQEYNTAIIHVCKALRAAAEKEVGK